MNLINVDQLPEPFGHYSHAVAVGGWVFVSGLLPFYQDNTSGKATLAVEPEKQAEQILQNLEMILLESGTTLNNVAQIRFYVPDVQQRKVLEPLYAAKLGDHRPARTIVPCGELRDGACFMLDAVAVQPA